MTIAQSIVGTNKDGGRPDSDFYPTPPEATEALLRVENFYGTHIWEPACGKGDISEVLKSHGYNVLSTDLYSYGYSKESGIDFLKTTKLYAPNIVTNPPFKLAEEFILHAKELEVSQLALLCKLAFLEGQYRSTILESTKLTRVHVFRKRLTMTRNGEPMRNGGMIAFAWYVWECGYTGKPEIDWI